VLDARDKPTWVALELTKAGEARAVEGGLAASLRSEMGVTESHPLFVPYATYLKGGRRVSIKLIEGYAFVGSGLAETRYFALERGSLVERVMSSRGAHGMRVLQTIPEAKIHDMMAQLRTQVSSDLEIGAHVKVIGGNYTHLDGEIVDLQGDRAAVRITMRSLDVVAFLPKVFLDSVTNPAVEVGSELDPLDVAVGSEYLPEK